MPSTTPNRNYPFPLNPDPINVAGDIEALARQVDLDMQDNWNSQNADVGTLTGWINDERAARIAADNALVAQLKVLGWFGRGDGSGQDATNTGLQFVASYLVVTLNGFGSAQIDFPTPFRYPPVVITSGAESGMPQVGTTGAGGAGTPGTSTTFFNVVARAADGSNLPDAVIAFNYLAVGLSP